MLNEKWNILELLKSIDAKKKESYKLANGWIRQSITQGRYGKQHHLVSRRVFWTLRAQAAPRGWTTNFAGCERERGARNKRETLPQQDQFFTSRSRVAALAYCRFQSRFSASNFFQWFGKSILRICNRSGSEGVKVQATFQWISFLLYKECQRWVFSCFSNVGLQRQSEKCWSNQQQRPVWPAGTVAISCWIIGEKFDV